MAQWRLSAGIHMGTMMSRECKSVSYDSLEDCKKALQSLEKFCKDLGNCYIWFATAFGPNGEKIVLHEGVPYK